MIARIQLRNDTASAWTIANPILAQGEMGIESDTLKQKVGDGTTAWNSLEYSAQPTTDADLQTLDKTIVGAINEVNSDLVDHIGDVSNPHSVTATQVGLGNVDNTSDVTKMTVSTFSGLNTTDKTIVGAINEANTIKTNEVTNSHLAQIPTMTIKGNNTGATADPIDLTVAQVDTMLGITKKSIKYALVFG